MIDLIAIQTKLDQWSKANPEVMAIYLFGSQAEGRATAHSDVDLAILTAPTMSRSTLWQLEEQWPLEIATYLQEIRNTDVFMLNLAPLAVRFHIITQGQRLISHNLSATIAYESYTCRQYWDFQPYLRRQQELLHARIKEQWDESQRRQYQQTFVQTQSIHRRIKATATRK